jgi:phage shock protein A/lia operon protein LiaH
MTRISTLIKAYIYEGLEKLEDPALMVKQYMRDMKKEINQLEARIRKQSKLEQELVHHLQAAKELFVRREEQAKMAVQAGNEELARKILLNKKEVWQQMDHYEKVINKNAVEIKGKKLELDQLQTKYEQLKEKNLELIVRVQGVKASKQSQLFESDEAIKREDEEEFRKKHELEVENELSLMKANIEKG